MGHPLPVGLDVRHYEITFDLESETSSATSPQTIPVLLPHEMANAIFKMSGVQFQKSFLQGDRSSCWAFWDNLHKHFPSLPTAAESPDVLSMTLPIMYHVDGAEVHKNSEHYQFSWSSFFGGGDVWDFKFLIVPIPHWRMTKASNKKNVFKELSTFHVAAPAHPETMRERIDLMWGSMQKGRRLAGIVVPRAGERKGESEEGQ